MNKKFIFLGLVILILAAAGTAFKAYRDYQQKEFESLLQSANDLMQSGETEGAVPLLEKAEKKSDRKDEESLARLNLGIAYLTNNPQKGVSILKEISLDASYPGFIKAQAVNALLNFFYYDFADSKKNLDFAKKYVFVGEKWISFANEGLRSRAELELAMRKGFEWSLGMYPTFEAEYGAALWYGDQLKHGQTPREIAETYADILKDHVRKGDTGLASIDVSSRPKAVIAFEYIIKGLAIEGLAHEKRIDFAEVEETYNKAINLLEKNSPTVFDKDAALYARLHLASFLSRTNQDQNHKKIIETLSPIYSMRDTSFFRFLKLAKDADVFDDDYLRGGIIRLSKIDPSFKKLLTSLGWRTENFTAEFI